MHLHFEQNTNAKCDCSILSLSWMGKVPDELPEEEGWKLNRTNYYQEGWLATGNVRGVVGVTFTTSHCRKNAEVPQRTNYNLRGHRSDVILVKWNEPYQKLASCDSSGVIFVWIKYEGRWSIELINDRNTPVTHFSWSHDGRMALICYQDGFVLVGSVAGQRYWSSMLNLDTTISCGIWTPDDQQVYFGTTGGEIIIMDVHGAMVSQVELHTEAITNMAWSCEKFKMEEGEDTEPGVSNAAERTFVLAVSFQNGHIYLLKNYDDVSPIHIRTDFDGKHMAMEWSNSRELLAVAGTLLESEGRSQDPPVYTNVIKFYSDTGILLYTTTIPGNQMPVSAMTWGHNDRRVFVATGSGVQVARAWRRVGSLQLLARLSVRAALKKPAHLALLPLPPRLAGLVASLFTQTISCCVPEPSAVREFVSRASHVGRLHCTMLRGGGDGSLGAQGTPSVTYTLYLEHMGGLVPLLKGRRFSKIRPEFVIFDPQSEGSETDASHWFRIKSNGDVVSNTSSSGNSSAHSHSSNSSTHQPPSYVLSDTSDTDKDEGCSGSPRLQRRKKGRHRSAKAHQQPPIDKDDDIKASDELGYIDSLPEDVPLVEVTSNIWGTKFKMHGLAKNIPANLGQVTYKTSLLHLQPRQMTLVMTELRDNFPIGPDPNFNPNIFSEDEEDVFQQLTPKAKRKYLHEIIAPSSPRTNHTTRTRSSLLNYEFLPVPGQEQNNNNNTISNVNGNVNNSSAVPALAKAESYEDEFPYGEDTTNSNIDNNVRPNIVNSNSSVRNHGRDQNSVPPSYSRAVTRDNNDGTQAQTYSNAAVRNHSSPITNGGYSPSGGLGRSGSSGSQRSGGSHSGRHAISPLCCEGSVPTLQSPKNAVAPSDIIFDRPPAQTMMSYHSSGADYSQNIQQVKSNMETHNQSQFHLSLDHNRQVLIKKMDSHIEAVTNRILNTGRGESAITQASVHTPRASLHNIHESHSAMFKYCTRKDKQSPNCEVKKDDLKYIDEEGNGSLSPDSIDNTCPRVGNVLPITPVGIPIASAPISDTMIRSCSVGYLDVVNSQLVPCEITLAMLRKEAPKRLVLVNKKNKNNFSNNSNNRNVSKRQNNQPQNLNLKLDSKTINETTSKPPKEGRTAKMPNLKTCGKSKSLDSSEMFMMAKNDITTLPTNEEEPSNSKYPTMPDKELDAIEVARTNNINTNKAAIEKTEAVTANMNNNNSKPKRQGTSKLGFFNSRTPILGRKKRRDHPTCDLCKCITPGIDPPSPSSTPDPYICIACQESSNNNTPTKKKGFFRERYSPGSDKSRSSSPRVPTEGNNSEIEIERAPTPSPNEQKASGSISGPAWTLALEQLLHLLRERSSGGSGGTTTPPVANTPSSTPRLPRSSPASPAPSKKNKRTASASPIRKHLLNSPLLNRRRNKSKTQESSDDEMNPGSGDDVVNGKNYRDLETFQKAQLRQKLKRGKIEPVGGTGVSMSQPHTPVRREFVMHNKAPMWNESSQVYQLDFGGRVTQESAKNFQIEFRGKQVMQFGRIDGNAYTLDFQYPFSALQAFAVALANVTQRLK